MKKLVFIFIMVALSTMVFAGEGFLIKIELDQAEDLNFLEEMQLPLYYQYQNQLFTAVSSDKLEILNQKKIYYTILDSDFNPDNTYLLTSKKNTDLELRTEWGDELYNNRKGLILLKTELLSADIYFSDYRAVSLKTPVRNFKNINKYYTRSNNTFLHDFIQDYTSQVNPDNLHDTIQSLQDFQTRFALADNRDAVAQWIKDQFIAVGLTDVVIDSFYVENYNFFNYPPTWQKNVVATLPGTTQPDDYIVIGAHWDSIVTPNINQSFTNAPGADDNATGVAATLEIARIMVDNNYEPKKTIKFVAFAIEELGLIGSYNYAGNAFQNDKRIHLMLNNDMIGYTNTPEPSWAVRIIPYAGFYYLMDIAIDTIEDYTSLQYVYYGGSSPGSDSYPFFYYGYPAIFFIESFFNPYYHSVDDLLVHLDMDFCAEITKISTAMSLYTDFLPIAPKEITLINGGTGHNLVLETNYQYVDDYFSHYNVYLGTSPGEYDSTWQVTEDFYIIDNLDEGVLYYVGVSVEDVNGLESMIIERSRVTSSIPGTPQNVQISITGQDIHLNWDGPSDYDLLGYNIYKSADNGENFVLQNSEPIPDNSYFDDDLQPGIFYLYAITSVDDNFNESEYSEFTEARLLSLDQGILLVSYTQSGTGHLNPPIDGVSTFYSNVLEDFEFSEFDAVNNTLRLIDIGAYSTVLLHFNSINSSNPLSQSTINILNEYLDIGGNILANGFMLSYVFDQNTMQRFGVDSSFIYGGTRFYGAIPTTANYPSLNIDEEKTPSTLNHHLINIEAFNVSSYADEIYSYNTNYDHDSSQGAMFGESVGVENLTETYKTVILSFPLYFIQTENVKDLMHYILHVLFEEELETEHPGTIYLTDKLYQNYPNPFNPDTNIKYQIDNATNVIVDIFNVRGQLINVLVDDFKSPGIYSVKWNGKDLNNIPVPSGIYFYRLKTDEKAMINKMLLLK